MCLGTLERIFFEHLRKNPVNIRGNPMSLWRSGYWSNIIVHEDNFNTQQMQPPFSTRERSLPHKNGRNAQTPNILNMKNLIFPFIYVTVTCRDKKSFSQRGFWCWVHTFEASTQPTAATLDHSPFAKNLICYQNSCQRCPKEFSQICKLCWKMLIGTVAIFYFA